MKFRLMAGLAGLLAGVSLWLLIPRQQAGTAVHQSPAESSASPGAVAKVRNSSPSLTESTTETTRETTPAVFPKEEVSSPARPPSLAAAAEPPDGPEIAPGLTPINVLENMRSIFRQYSQRFGGNPTGINREITAALNGGNSKQVVFLNPEDGARVNARGELVDNWGTPYFFHQLSRTEMEIHSAGPDRKMWTEDDLVLK